MSDTTEEEKVTPVAQPKIKKARTPEQLEVLSKAREKALQIRKENAKLRQAEKKMDKDKKSKEVELRKQKVKEFYRDEETPPSVPVPVEEVTKIKTKKEKKKKIIYVEESESSEEEEEIVYVKKPKKVKPPPEETHPVTEGPPQKSRGQINYETKMRETFGKHPDY